MARARSPCSETGRLPILLSQDHHSYLTLPKSGSYLVSNPKLNKAQVKALKDTYRENPTETRRLIMRAKAEVVNAISALKWQGTASEMISLADDTGS